MADFALAQWVRQNHPRVDVIIASRIAKTTEKAGDLCEEGLQEKPYEAVCEQLAAAADVAPWWRSPCCLWLWG